MRPYARDIQYVTYVSVPVKSPYEWACDACAVLCILVSVCMKSACRIWNAGREFKVLDKTKRIWQAPLIRQQFGDPFQTRRKKENIG